MQNWNDWVKNWTENGWWAHDVSGSPNMSTVPDRGTTSMDTDIVSLYKGMKERLALILSRNKAVQKQSQ